MELKINQEEKTFGKILNISNERLKELLDSLVKLDSKEIKSKLDSFKTKGLREAFAYNEIAKLCQNLEEYTFLIRLSSEGGINWFKLTS